MITIRANFRPAPRPGRRAVQQIPPPEPRPSPRQVSRLARQLALAHHIERLIEAGAVPDFAEVARTLGLTRARLTQIVNLTLLSPEIQARTLTGRHAPQAHALRAVADEPDWEVQNRLLWS